MKSFKSHLERSSHLEWRPGDVEHVLKEDFSKPIIRKEHSSLYPEETSMHPDDVWKHLKAVSGFRGSGKHYEALHEYKGDSLPYNSHLRNLKNHRDDGIVGLTSLRYHRHVQHLDEATSSVSLSHPMSVYRGFSTDFPIHHLKEGHEFVDHGFTGTSTVLSIGRKFGGHYDDEHYSWRSSERRRRTMSMLHLPAGTKGLYVDHPGSKGFGLSHEREFLLHRGSRFRVMGHSLFKDERDDHVHIVHAQLIGQEPKKLLEREVPKEVADTREVLKKHGFSQSHKNHHPAWSETYEHEQHGVIRVGEYGNWKHELHSGATIKASSLLDDDDLATLDTHLSNYKKHGILSAHGAHFGTWKEQGWKHVSRTDEPNSVWHHYKSNSVLRVNKKNGHWNHTVYRDGKHEEISSSQHIHELPTHMYYFNKMDNVPKVEKGKSER